MWISLTHTNTHTPACGTSLFSGSGEPLRELFSCHHVSSPRVHQWRPGQNTAGARTGAQRVRSPTASEWKSVRRDCAPPNSFCIWFETSRRCFTIILQISRSSMSSHIAEQVINRITVTLHFQYIPLEQQFWTIWRISFFVCYKLTDRMNIKM